MPPDAPPPTVASGDILPEMPPTLFPPLPANVPPLPPKPPAAPPPADDGSSTGWKDILAHTVGRLFMDPDPVTGKMHVSFLSTSLTFMMVLSMHHWWYDKDIPATMTQIFTGMIAAKLGHGGVTAFREFIAMKRETANAANP